MKTSMNISLAVLAALSLIACDKKATGSSAAGNGHADHSHDDGHNHDDGHDHAEGDDHAHGATVELGEQTAGAFTVRASRDGAVTPGGEAPIDAWVSVSGALKISAVRFWIGTADARGSVKARAELEKDNWHTHVEVPKPLPEGSELWIEIETESGEKGTVHFDLKQ